MAIVGIIALTLVFGYFFLGALMFSAMMLLGFDEFHIAGGLLMLAAAGGIGYGWWLLVGHIIHISVSV